MVDSRDDREDYLSTVKDNMIRLTNEFRDIALVIGDPESTDPEKAADALRRLKAALHNNDDPSVSIDMLECVTEFDELGG